MRARRWWHMRWLRHKDAGTKGLRGMGSLAQICYATIRLRDTPYTGLWLEVFCNQSPAACSGRGAVNISVYWT
jgi:hypothetical protein